MFKRNADEFRYRVSRETLRRAAEADAYEALEIMKEFWSSLVVWAARHGLDIRPLAEILVGGNGCPVHKLPWVWDKDLRELRCPLYPECGCVVIDRNEPDPEIAAVRAAEQRERKASTGKMKTYPIKIAERERELEAWRKPGRVE